MQTELIQTTGLVQAEARLPRWMTLWAIVGAFGGLLSGHVWLAAGFAFGASLAILNYFWLHGAIETLFSANRVRVPRMVMAKLVLRYPLAFGAVYFFYRTGWLPFAAILAGLFVPVGGVLIEAGYQIREGLRKT